MTGSEVFVSTQLSRRPGIIELGFGQPDQSLLPLRELRYAASRVLDEFGPVAAAYGAERGPAELIDAVSARLGINESSPKHEEILITGGTSQGLDETLRLVTRPGDPILVESPTYNLALAIMRDHDLEPIGIPIDEGGVKLDYLRATIRELRRLGQEPRVLYTVPTFHNPTGTTLSLERRRELVELAQSEKLLILEDDAYRELFFDDPPPASLWCLAGGKNVARFGTVSKSFAPGLRVGWITAEPSLIDRLLNGGLRLSGGGVSHFSAMVVASIASTNLYVQHIERLRTTYRERRDALLSAVQDSLPECDVVLPNGGLFLWIHVPGLDSGDALLRAAEGQGVAFVPGSLFYPPNSPPDSTAIPRTYIRLSFAPYGIDELAEGVSRLGRAYRSIERRSNRPRVF